MKSKRTLAARSSPYLDVVPTGGRLWLICASLGLAATRNVRLVWLASEMRASGVVSAGLGGVGGDVGGGVDGGGLGGVGGGGLGGGLGGLTVCGSAGRGAGVEVGVTRVARGQGPGPHGRQRDVAVPYRDRRAAVIDVVGHGDGAGGGPARRSSATVKSTLTTWPTLEGSGASAVMVVVVAALFNGVRLDGETLPPMRGIASVGRDQRGGPSGGERDVAVPVATVPVHWSRHRSQ